MKSVYIPHFCDAADNSNKEQGYNNKIKMTEASPPVANDVTLSYNAKRSRVECDDDKIGIHCSLLAQTLQRRGVAPPARFKASTKDLYSDFVVREIPVDDNPEKKALQLTSFGIANSSPQLTRSEKRDKKQQEAAALAAPLASDDSAALQLKSDLVSAFSPIIGQENAEKMAEAVAIANEDKIVVGVVADKEKRGLFHSTVKALIGSKYISSAENGEIVLGKATANAKREQDRRSNASKAPKYLHFTLYKENTDSASAFRFIANQCGLSAKSLLFSGTKDKRAVTLQRVACRGLEPARLEKVNRMSVSRNGIVRVGDYVEKDSGLSLGELGGNHFTIALRIVEESVAEALKSNTFPLNLIQETLNETGFINYFGPQRFGTTSVLTSDVGRLLLNEQYKEAITAILESRCEISPEAQSMVDAFTTLPSPSCFTEALSNAPQYCFAERDLLKFLSNNPDNYKGAFSAMQRTSVMMYFHAVQSWFWNEWVSRRLTQRPFEPIVGDIVMIGGNNEDESLATTNQHLSQVHTVTEEDVAQKRFAIFDVVMTVPGCDTKLLYPSIDGFMTKEKLTSEVTSQGLSNLFNGECEMARQFNFYGTYRRVVHSLKDLKFSVKTYNSPSEVLIPTDLHLIKQRELQSDGSAAPPVLMTAAPQTAAHQGVAVIAEFSLPAGAYATCVLREFCETIRGTD